MHETDKVGHCEGGSHFCGIMYEGLLKTKLMRFGLPNRIDVVDSNLKSESERRIVVDSDSNDLIESTRSNMIYNRYIFDYIDKKLIKISI